MHTTAAFNIAIRIRSLTCRDLHLALLTLCATAVNFDIEVIKPGCGGVPSFTYVKKLQFTLLLMTFSGLLFGLACFVRLCLRARAISRTVAPANGDELDHDLDELADVADDSHTEGAEHTQIEGQPDAVKRVQSQPSRGTHERPTLWKGLSPHQRRVMERSAQLSAVWLERVVLPTLESSCTS